MSPIRTRWILLALVAVAVLGRVVSGQPSPRVRTLTEQEMVDMMQGSSIQASRSANTAPTIQAVKDGIAAGRKYTLIPLDEVPDGWTVAVPVAVGGGGAWEYVRERIQKQNIPTIPDASVRAIQALERHVGKKFDALIRFEGAAATLQTFQAASALGIPVVDACPVGRSVPELQMQLTFVDGLPLAPAAAVTRWGDVMILDRTVDGYRVEDLFRAAAVASGGGVSAVQNVMSGRDAKRSVIKGSVTTAIEWGKALREARAAGADPVMALLRASGGMKLFRGTVTKADMKGDRGFTWWDVEIKGTHEYEGHSYKLFLKNENVVAWLDGTPDATAPDIIANLDPKTGDTLFGQGLGAYPMNADVVMVAIPSSPLWRTPKALEVLGPRHFGFDIEYRSLDELRRTRPKFGAE
jgi:uncharacterized protein